MSSRCCLVGLTAGLALAACANGPNPGSWTLADTPVAPALAFEGARGPLLTMACQPRSGAVEVTVSGAPQDGALVQLHSGKVWNRYVAAGHPAADDPSAFQIDLKLAASDPVLQHFSDTGELSVVLADRTLALPNAFAPAHDFLNLCRLPG